MNNQPMTKFRQALFLHNVCTLALRREWVFNWWDSRVVLGARSWGKGVMQSRVDGQGWKRARNEGPNHRQWFS